MTFYKDVITFYDDGITYHLWRHLISVERYVNKQGTVIPKLLTIGQGAKN